MKNFEIFTLVFFFASIAVLFIIAFNKIKSLEDKTSSYNFVQMEQGNK